MVGWIVLSVVVLVVLGLTALFVAALIERIRILDPQPDDAPGDPFDATDHAWISEAEELGYRPLGRYLHLGGYKIRYRFSLLPSADRLVLLLIYHTPKLDRKQWFMSVLRDGRMIITADKPPLLDPTGSRLIDAFPEGPMRYRERYHRERIAEHEGDVVPWKIEALPGALALIDQARINKMVERGWARWRDADHGTWSYSLGGGPKILFGSAAVPLEEARERSKAKIREYQADEE